MLEAQMRQEWLVDQKPITDHRGLNELKIGILGVGQMGQCIAKTFKVLLNKTVEKIVSIIEYILWSRYNILLYPAFLVFRE